MDKVRLNNFVLWCKNWYQPIDNRMDNIAQARKILTLDGYLSCNNPISIALEFIDELVDKGLIKPIRLRVWNEDVVRGMTMYDITYNESVLYVIRTCFAFECRNLQLAPRFYSRELYKLGFVGPPYLGNSYKMLNFKARKVLSN